MDALHSQPTVRLSRRTLLKGIALAALAPAGCVGKRFARKDAKAPVATGRLVTAWKNQVVYAPDTTRGGAVFPGLLARVYLFGPDVSTPYIGDGSMSIALYDASGQVDQPRLTDIVNFDAVSLKQMAKIDFVGQGYTIFFPWFKYRPEVTHVFINVEYTAADGSKLYHQSGTLSIDHAETQERTRRGLPAYNAREEEILMKQNEAARAK